MPLYYGRENLAQEEQFLLTSIIPVGVQKAKKYGFVRRSWKYILIDDALYIRAMDLVLWRVV